MIRPRISSTDHCVSTAEKLKSRSAGTNQFQVLLPTTSAGDGTSLGQDNAMGLAQ